MSVRSRKSGRVRRQAMPVETSIPWKPLRDSHYIVAGLQPGGGGLRQIFVRQSTLREVQAVAGDPERPVVGLLLGERLECSATFTPYVLITAHVEMALASAEERVIADAIRALRGHVAQRHAAEVLGWFCGSRSADAEVSRTHAAVHAACFEERWQSVLILTRGGRSGAFFLPDSTAGRWFHAPFYETTDTRPNNRTPLPTCVAWPAYVTTASVVPVAEESQPAAVPSRRAFVAAQASAPPRRQPGAFANLIVTVRRTPANAMAGVSRAAGAARRSAFDIALVLFGHAVVALRSIRGRVARIRAERVARAARRKAQADAARVREAERRAREEERRAKEAAERRAAREEAQRRAAEAEKQRAAEADARRAAEAEARRAAEAEARRLAAEEAERRRAAEAEAARQAAELEVRRQAEEARRRAQAEEARRAAEAEAQRAAEAEAQRLAAEEARRRAAEAEARKVAEEAQRKAAEEEQRRAAEAEARRRAAEAELEARYREAELEALRVSLVVAATRLRLARPPVEGSRRDTSKFAATRMADHEDTTASDRPDRYFALAMREGFEISVQVPRGSPEDPETLSLLYESESGLRLIVFSTDDRVRAASLHYNLRTEDESLLEGTPPALRDLASRTIYARESCVSDLRARCRRLRESRALEPVWKVSPTFQDSMY